MGGSLQWNQDSSKYCGKCWEGGPRQEGGTQGENTAVRRWGKGGNGRLGKLAFWTALAEYNETQ